jgi:hypothetical protein
MIREAFAVQGQPFLGKLPRLDYADPAVQYLPRQRTKPPNHAAENVIHDDASSDTEQPCDRSSVYVGLV